jgi:hypothetical protein
MGNLEDLVSKKAEEFVESVKGLVKDHLEHEHDDPSPQTIEENYPSTVKKDKPAVPVVTSEVEVNDPLGVNDLLGMKEEVKPSPSPAFSTPTPTPPVVEAPVTVIPPEPDTHA